MTMQQAREAITAGNLLNHEGKKPVAIARNRENINDCWLLYFVPDEEWEPIPCYHSEIREYLVDVTPAARA